MSLALPWEVVERVIDHSSDDIATLYSFTLTCRDLNPRSTIVLLARVQFKNRDQIFSLCDLLRAKPHLQSAVRSITVPPDEFSPHPLLRMLHNLSNINFKKSSVNSELWNPVWSRFPPWKHPGRLRASVWNSSVLSYCHLFGDNVQSLSLYGFFFPSLSAFSRLLLAFRRIRSLSCSKINIIVGRGPSIGRLSQQLHLQALTVDVSSVFPRISKLLGEVSARTVRSLDLHCGPRGYVANRTLLLLILPTSSWVNLTSLTLRTSLQPMYSVQEIVTTLDELRRRAPNLREVLIDVEVPTMKEIVHFLHHSGVLKLEKMLLHFSQPKIGLSVGRPVNARRYRSWREHVEQCFPALAMRDAVKLKAQLSDNPRAGGHDSRITTTIVTSADSQWAATGSDDDTIIVWDLRRGSVHQEWFIQPSVDVDPFRDPSGLKCLSFSPDSRYLVSTGPTPEVTVWDLHRNARKVISLGNGDLADHCAWSPDATSLVATFIGETSIRIWETSTFQELHCDEKWGCSRGSPLVFSPDGRWVFTGIAGVGHIWNIASGKLERLWCPNGTSAAREIFAAAFHPGGVRLVMGYQAEDSAMIGVWDVETGAVSLVMHGRLWVDAFYPRCLQSVLPSYRLAYSPDGNYILSWWSNSGWKHDCRRGPACIWDASNGTLLARLDTPNRAVGSACFSPCSRYIASASIGGEALLWRVSDRSCIAKVPGDGSPVEHVAIVPDGTVLCCGAEDGTVFFRRMCDLVPMD